MRRSRALSALGAGVVIAGAAAVLAVTQSAQAATGVPVPAHVFAPYFEAYNGDSLSGLAQQSGNKYLTMAFLQTNSPGSCTAYWNGDTGMPIASSTFGSDISTIQSGGGTVVPSFGGYAADHDGTEIADSCTNVSSIAAQYEKVITTYNLTRIDLDIEDNSLGNSAAIDRRNKAIKQVEDWAAANARTVQFVYTLPTTTHGLDSGLGVLQNAVTNNARVDIVNIMTFDYYDNASHEMANDTKTAAAGLVNQLGQLYPGKSTSQLWGMVGVTEMPGIDDFGAAETFTTADAPAVESWAVSQGIAEISMWALQRDNGGCPGTGGSDGCSGISQSTWQFSHTWEAFNSGGGTASPTPSSTRSASPSPSPSHSPTASPTPTPTGGGGTGVTNGGFETGALSPWTCTGGLGSVVSSPVHSGSKALKLAASNSDDAQCSQTIHVTANHTYTLSAYVQGAYAFIGTTGAASDVSTWTASAPGYTKLSVTFTSGSSGQLQIWLHGWYGTGTVYADDVTVA
ncbi:carbohydrate binding domain-containing protein [Rugosimonospora africana]|uniref:Chitinase n=1 Tax=Rugosimonospora africana TaxID=556532 RepID=A0A8J3R0D6_9ACTN|nr:carbohydrate binding domain-containing protein [Rugosimonospora africana]GIH17916.1 chitinase [Rugosimonospora africana]